MGEISDRLRTLRDVQGTSCLATVVSLVESGVTRYATGGALGNGRGQVDINLSELFSDRTFDRGDNPPFTDPNPFDTGRADSSTLTIDPNGLEATMVLNSWGGGKLSFLLQDQGGVLSGVSNPAGANSDRGYFLITVGEIQFPPKIG